MAREGKYEETDRLVRILFEKLLEKHVQGTRFRVRKVELVRETDPRKNIAGPDALPGHVVEDERGRLVAEFAGRSGGSWRYPRQEGWFRRIRPDPEFESRVRTPFEDEFRGRAKEITYEIVYESDLLRTVLETPLSELRAEMARRYPVEPSPHSTHAEGGFGAPKN